MRTPASDNGSAEGRPTPTQRLRAKSTVVLSVLVLAAVLFGTASMAWFDVVVPTPVQEVEVTVRGTQASPAVPALALVAAAAGLALTIAGPVLRWIVAAVIPLAALGALLAVVGALRDPQHASETAVGEAAGIIGAQAQHTVSVWPWLSLVAAGLLALIGAWTLTVMRGWSTARTTKYQRNRAAGKAQEGNREGFDPDGARRDGIDTWDALSEGDDPTGR